jgi:hypothetical protein
MTDEGDLSDYLGVKIDQLPNGTIKVTQPHLIQSVLDDLNFNERMGTKKTPAVPTIKLHRDAHGEKMDESWNYRSVVGKMNFIEKSTRPDIAYAVHQCARFSEDPKASHAAAIKRIGKYLLATKDKGMILNPNNHSFDCWVDADFVGNWDRVNANLDPGTAKSWAGYIITYGGRVSNSMGVEDVAGSRLINHRGRVQCDLDEFARCDIPDAVAQRDGKRVVMGDQQIHSQSALQIVRG